MYQKWGKIVLMKFCENECNRVNNMDRFIFINILRGRNRLKNKFITEIKDKKNFNNTT